MISGEYPSEGVRAGNPVGQGQKPLEPFVLALDEQLHIAPTFGAPHNRADGHGDDVQELVPLALVPSRVLRIAKMLTQAATAITTHHHHPFHPIPFHPGHLTILLNLNQRFLRDRCHLLEHLHDGASALTPGDPESTQAWVRAQANRIDAGGVARVVTRMPEPAWSIRCTGWPVTWSTGKDSWITPPPGRKVCPSEAARWKGAIAT